MHNALEARHNRQHCESVMFATWIRGDSALDRHVHRRLS